MRIDDAFVDEPIHLLNVPFEGDRWPSLLAWYKRMRQLDEQRPPAGVVPHRDPATVGSVSDGPVVHAIAHVIHRECPRSIGGCTCAGVRLRTMRSYASSNCIH